MLEEQRKFRFRTLILKMEGYYLVPDRGIKRVLGENKNEQIRCLFIEKGIGASSWPGPTVHLPDDLPYSEASPP